MTRKRSGWFWLSTALVFSTVAVASESQCVSGDCLNGFGVFSYSSGARYEGNWVDGRLKGHGRMLYPDGSVYEGDFKDDEPHGNGETVWAQGPRHTGLYSAGSPHGKGVKTWSDGGRYEGDFYSGYRHGKGSYNYGGEHKGVTYVGDWFHETITGEGTYTWPSGDTYTGEVRNGEFDGVGTKRYSDGTVYVGTWAQGERHGRGKITYRGDTEFKGDVYDGDWVLDERTGHGTYTWATGDKYVGAFVNGQLNGPGTIIWSNGTRESGRWVDGELGAEMSIQIRAASQRGLRSRANNQQLARELKSAAWRFEALVIGNNEYQHLRNLRTARRDAVEIKDLLETRYGFNVELLLDATRSEILTAVNKLRRRADESTNVLIYYAGHGDVDPVTNAGFWQPVDAHPDNNANWLANASLTNALAAMKARHVVVIADSCFSGTLTREGSTAGTAAVTATDSVRTEFIRRVGQKRSRKALTSGGLEPVDDLSPTGSGHSVFANAFIRTLKDNEQVIDMDWVYRRVRYGVVKDADQTPLYATIRKVGDDDGHFILVPR